MLYLYLCVDGNFGNSVCVDLYGAHAQLNEVNYQIALASQAGRFLKRGLVIIVATQSQSTRAASGYVVFFSFNGVHSAFRARGSSSTNT